jgi:ribulose-phosphate 3-epimerase
MATPRYRLAPSILSADFLELGKQVLAVQTAGADQIHVDVMDGHFVDNLSMGPAVVRALKRIAKIPLDVHLMITDPLRYLDAFIDAGADHITFHVEAESPVRDCIRRLRERRVGVGISIRPETPASRVLDLIPDLDMILVMTVNPGFGGQAFMAETLEKIPPLREREAEVVQRGGLTARGFVLDIQVDGGIGLDTVAQAARAGANVFVAGSSVFGDPDPAAALRGLRQRLNEVVDEHPKPAR